jgi:O-antigen/teichoic acid export membrane protein
MDLNKKIFQIIKRFTEKDLIKILYTEGAMKVINILLLPLYLNLMSKNEYANYGFILAFVGSSASILNLSFYVYQSKYTHLEVEPKKLFQKLVSSLTVFNLFFFLIIPLFINPEKALKIVLGISNVGIYYTPIALAISISSLFLVLKTYLYPAGKVRLYQNLVFVIGLLIHFIVLILFILLDVDKALLRITVYALVFFLMFLWIWKKLTCEFRILKYQELKKILKVTLPLIIGSISAIIINLIDRYLLNSKNLYETVADFNLALTLTLLISFVTSSINDTFQVEFFAQKSISQSLKKLKSILKFTLGINLILSLLLYLGTYIAIEVKFIPQSYESVLLILPYVLVSKSITSLTNFITHTYLLFDKTSLNAYQSLILSLLSIPIAFYFINKYDTIGACYSIVIVSVIGFLISLGFSRTAYLQHLNKLESSI